MRNRRCAKINRVRNSRPFYDRNVPWCCVLGSGNNSITVHGLGTALRCPLSARTYAAVVAALSIADFSLIAFLGAASWPLNLRFKALSTFAPNANLLKFSVFSGLGTNRCCWRRLLSRRLKPISHSFISAMRGSPFASEVLVLTVPSETASDGAPL